ncbi:MAG: hypothetical protein H7301_04870 [Cryobacterium sp.]|nr:hypothetical protein [Oligoflexia bacterium]
MNLKLAVTDLRFVIGLFLTLIGLLVLLSFLTSGSDVAQGIHVNLLGGGMLITVGGSLALSALFAKAPAEEKRS